MASAELSRRVGKVVGYPPLSEMRDLQRREFHESLLEADSFEDLPGSGRRRSSRRSRPGQRCGLSAATKHRDLCVSREAHGQPRTSVSSRSTFGSPSAIVRWKAEMIRSVESNC
jgi:hypothetical protein